LRSASRASPAKAGEGKFVIPRRNRNRRDNPRVSKAKTVTDTKEAPLEVFGSIRQVFPSTTFSVELNNGHTILAHIAGRLRRHHIKILPGDRVDVELSPYDLTKGRIVYRYRAGEERRSS
jgi:translation initiation factor IF-1